MITGVGSVNGHLFDDPATCCAVMSYDYTVFAGTQGKQNHRKTDRLIGVAEDGRMPMVLFAEGGGGRPVIPMALPERPRRRLPVSHN